MSISISTARAILGPDNVHGPDQAQQHFGPFTADQLAARELIPYAEATLRECAGTHILLATHPLSLPDVHARHPERFLNDPDDPWFATQRQRQVWSAQPIIDPWLLVRMDVVPGSWSKSIDAQKQHVASTLPRERLILPGEYAYAATLHYLVTGKKLCPGYWVRFPVQTAEGCWVGAGWDGGRLYVGGWYGGPDGDVAVCAARLPDLCPPNP
jgi:hypothetical protein